MDQVGAKLPILFFMDTLSQYGLLAMSHEKGILRINYSRI